MIEKHNSIIEALEKLKVRLGKNAFHVVDHWDADLCAVGVARPDNHGVLAYISTRAQKPDQYFVSLELPPIPDNDMPYTSAGEYEVKSFDELVELIQKHFSSYP